MNTQHEGINELFGEARSIVYGAPSAEAWEELCVVVDLGLEAAPDQVSEVWLPYLERALTAWPDHLRVSPEAWISRYLDRRGPGDLLRLGRVLRWPHSLTNTEAARLAAHPDAAHMFTHLGLDFDVQTGGALGRFLNSAPDPARLGWLRATREVALFGSWPRELSIKDRRRDEPLTRTLRDLGVATSHRPLHLHLCGRTPEDTWFISSLCEVVNALVHARKRPITRPVFPHITFDTCSAVVVAGYRRPLQHLALPDRVIPGDGDRITICYEDVWCETWEEEELSEEEREWRNRGWRHNLRTAVPDEVFTEHRALHDLAYLLHETFQTHTITFRGPCALEPKFRRGYMDAEDLFFNEGRDLFYEPQWE